MTVQWTDAALRDLGGCYDFLIAQGAREDIALEIIQQIEHNASQLARFPARGKVFVSERTGNKFRVVVQGNYRIFYACEKSFVRIMCVFDARQDLRRLRL